MKSYVGGQAVLEGVLMKVQDKYAIAVRQKGGKIKLVRERFVSKARAASVLGLPILRGIVILFEMMFIGIRALNWSANQQLEKDEKLTVREITLSVSISFLVALGLFIALPYAISSLAHNPDELSFHILDGILRFLILILYIVAISFFQDIRRLFQYHGAEHKTVNCYESGMDLTVANVRKCPTEHVRCGTSLIFFVVALSIVLFSVIRTEFWWLNVLLRIILIPLLVGISYEILRLSAAYPNSILIRYLIMPGLLVQALTAYEPDDRQIEVAIASMKAALA